MSKTLGGFLFVRNGVQYDYCFKESIESLLGVCDEVCVVDPGSDDGTTDILMEMCKRDKNLKVYLRSKQEWDLLRGKTKLSWYQNIAASILRTDYQFLCQADEIVSEKSYVPIRQAMETGAEGFLCTRVNLWGSPYTELNVSLNRMPCSPQVIRLTKRGYQTYDDGENIGAPSVLDFVKDIRIYHMGFVRKKEVMKGKIIHMQENVFEIGHDPKLDNMDVFDWKGWFSESDLKPISEPLPRIIQQWAKGRE